MSHIINLNYDFPSVLSVTFPFFPSPLSFSFFFLLRQGLTMQSRPWIGMTRAVYNLQTDSGFTAMSICLLQISQFFHILSSHPLYFPVYFKTDLAGARKHLFIRLYIIPENTCYFPSPLTPIPLMARPLPSPRRISHALLSSCSSMHISFSVLYNFSLENSKKCQFIPDRATITSKETTHPSLNR